MPARVAGIYPLLHWGGPERQALTVGFSLALPGSPPDFPGGAGVFLKEM